MAQLAIYIDEKLADRLEKAVKASGKSKSKWVSEAIEKELRDHWPEDFFDLAGSWEDDEQGEDHEGAEDAYEGNEQQYRVGGPQDDARHQGKEGRIQ